ncbi:hypothetical protein MHLP_02680 [Candidatus Mycoplasma haematolamae str. Purdue]|uniref:Uncharacterized protein n=1 Tax=Mycoplasma haematolamae (strain Purdue) TaxID=1212765 RepID=I7CFW4_MYCHA|nr:hypothetical protein [Candidatus Mycoplasma haematolamae]AFO52116.1 hypothetical protein MHLP_02680 [Candidatus Mycoplasma haematolamae str. Purdue]
MPGSSLVGIAKLAAAGTVFAGVTGGSYVLLVPSSSESTRSLESGEFLIKVINAPKQLEFKLKCSGPDAGLKLEPSFEEYKFKCADVSERPTFTNMKAELQDNSYGKGSLECICREEKVYECTYTKATNSINDTLKQVKQSDRLDDDGEPVLYLRPDSKKD